jgi:hypothetical protein
MQPPIYDALTYAGKAMTAWAAIGEGRFLDLLSAPPPNRPPGSVAMSYPFGFDRTFHGFHFRSVFVPVVLLGLAVWIAGSPEDSTDAWSRPLLGLAVSSMPILFQFEISDALPAPVYWGLVDNFMAGVSAVAAGAVVRGLRLSSLAWTALGFGAAAFSLLVKPAGLVTMGLVTLAFVTVSLVDRRWRFLLAGLVLAAVVEGGILAAALASPYLSPGTVAFYRGAVSLLREEMASPVTTSRLLFTLHTSVGLPLAASLLLAVGLWVLRGRQRFPFALLLVPPAAAAFAAGVLWIAATDLWQVRYGMPSFLMGVVFLVPFVLRVSAASPRWGRLALHSLWALGPLVLACLLPLRAPAVGVQRLWGVNLTSAGTREEVRRAERLIDSLDRRGRGAKLYSFYSGGSTAAFESVGYWKRLLDPTGHNFQVRLPLDWLTPPVFRVERIVSAEYVLFNPMRRREARDRTLARRSLTTFQEESALFHALFTGLDETSGVSVEWDGGVRLLRVTDSATLRRVLVASLRGYAHRPAFSRANPDLFGSDPVGEPTTSREPSPSRP